MVALRDPTSPGRTNAMYAFSRSVALAVTAAVVLFTHSSSWLRAVALAMVIVQASDAIVGATLRDRLKTVGPAFTAATSLAALLYFA